MLTVICFIFLALAITALVIGVVGNRRDWWGYDNVPYIACITICIVLVLCFVGTGIAVASCATKLHTASKYDEQIDIVTEMNTELEHQICSSVENYLKHEEVVFESIDIETAIGLFSIYPNLKSNELVQTLITTYQNNANEIKKLKIAKSELVTARWLVYFK